MRDVKFCIIHIWIYIRCSYGNILREMFEQKEKGNEKTKPLQIFCKTIGIFAVKCLNKKKKTKPQQIFSKTLRKHPKETLKFGWLFLIEILVLEQYYI